MLARPLLSSPALFGSGGICGRAVTHVPARLHLIAIASILRGGGGTPAAAAAAAATGLRMSSSGSAGGGRMIVVDDFARRQWKEDYKGLVIKGMSEEALEEKVNELFQKDPGALKDGYAPFCKHLFVPNFLEGALVDAVPITDDNMHKLRTEYQARKPGELAVLTRWFPLGEVQAPPATHLDLILYSREQIIKETEAMGKPPKPETAPWGLISIKAQTVDYEIPMNPITMMRNALGKEEGGSGVPIDREKYQQSVDFWSKHAVIS